MRGATDLGHLGKARVPHNAVTFQNRCGQQLSARLELPADGAPLAYALFAHCFTFSKDLEERSMRQHIRGLERPRLVLHSPTDNVVGVDNARLIFEAALHPKSFVSPHQAGHLLGRRQDARFAGAMVASWSAPNVGRDQAASWQADIRDNRTVVRTETGLRTEAMSNGFGQTLDEPLAVGGSNPARTRTTCSRPRWRRAPR